MKNKNNNAGFTLVELVIAILIAAMILGVAGTFLVFNVKGFNGSKDIISLQREGQLVMNQLSEILSEGQYVYYDSIGSDKLKFTNREGSDFTVEFKMDEKELWGQEGNNSPYIIGEHIESFTTDGKSRGEKEIDGMKHKVTNLVGIRLKFSKGNDNDKNEIELTEEVKLRNFNLD